MPRKGAIGITLGNMQEPVNEDYRTCPQCSKDCEPDPFATDEGIRIAFICADCGLHSVIDPFEADR